MAAFTGGDQWQVHDEAGRRKYLSTEELERFLNAANRLAPGPRALCHVLAYTGCRVSEASALTIHQLDTAGRLVIQEDFDDFRLLNIKVGCRLQHLAHYLPIQRLVLLSPR